MTGYLEASSTMHARGIIIDEKDYVFSLMLSLDIRVEEAYAFAYDCNEFKKCVGTEDEEVYLLSKTNEAQTMMGQQGIVQLNDLMSESLRAQIQSSALNLKNYKFTTAEAIQILNNLLQSRTSNLDESSVKDIVSIIKTLTATGALDTGDGGFSRHFIQIPSKFTALCTSCNREFDCFSGIGSVCPHCGQHYTWSDEEQRFYPQPSKL